MSKIFELEVNKNSETAYQHKKYSLGAILSMLFSRTLLFACFQMLIYLILKIISTQTTWEQSANWWPLTITLTNIACVVILHELLKKEKKRFLDFFEFHKGEIVKCFLIMSGLLLASFPIAYLPNIALGSMLFGNATDAVNMVYRPLPLWAAWTACAAFPLTMPLGELTVYFGYVMPRLETITRKKWLSFILPVVMLSLQHATAPLLFDSRFILWRSLMFLPFAVVIGLIIRWKPKLFPYILVGHIFIDVMTAVSILFISISV